MNVAEAFPRRGTIRGDERIRREAGFISDFLGLQQWWAALLSCLFSKGELIMARICSVTGKTRVKGSIIHRRGLTKKSGGIGTHVAKVTRRVFKPNVQRVKVRLANGQVKRVWVSAKALKAGKVEKA